MNDAKTIYESITSRGGRFSLNGTRVRVNDVAVSPEELAAIQEHELELARLVAAPKIGGVVQYGEIARSWEAVETKVEEWKKSFPLSKGYDWTREDWLTEFTERALNQAISDYIDGNADIHALHEAFRRKAEAHRRSGYVSVNGRRVQTVTPQIQPSAADFARMTRMLGVTPEQYYARSQAA